MRGVTQASPVKVPGLLIGGPSNRPEQSLSNALAFGRHFLFAKRRRAGGFLAGIFEGAEESEADRLIDGGRGGEAAWCCGTWVTGESAEENLIAN